MVGPAAPQHAHRGLHWRIWAAEAVGTALLMVGGLSAVALDFGPGSPVAEAIPSHSARLLITGLLFAGTGSLIALTPVGRLSGAHLNPSVTLAFRVLGHVSPHDLAGYLAAQLVGALLGAGVVRLLWGSTALAVHGGATQPTVSVLVALGLEAAMTATVVAVLLVCVAHRRLARFTPLVLWALIAALVWQVAPYTGTSLNPARSTGPAVVFNVSDELWIYLLAPPVGALAVAIAWRSGLGHRPPLTAKLFHDPRYASSMACALPAMDAQGPMRG